VFLDRDGTITREVDYLRRVEQLRLLPGAAQAIRRLNEAGLAVVVLTNQSGIARGLLTEEEFCVIQEVLSARLAARGAHLDGVYYCPHHPEATVARYRRECDGRKPAAGLVRCAARELDLDLAHSFAIGDRARDLAPGRSVGCATVLVCTGYGKREEVDWSEAWRPDHIARDLASAVAWVLEHRK
jgi:D-glycero-D-manno-heptose 1,7-bisphosphate phosphatase